MSIQTSTFPRVNDFYAFNNIGKIDPQPPLKTNPTVKPVPNPKINQIASANLDFNQWPELGVGYKKKDVPLGAGTADVEIIFNVPFDTLQKILNNQPFAVNLDAKLTTKVDIGLGKTKIELKTTGTATFSNRSSFPKLAIEGSAAIGVETKSDGNSIGNATRKNKTARYAGVTFKWDGGTPEFGSVTEKKGGPEWKRGSEDKEGKPIIPGILTVEGSVKVSKTGSALQAVRGAIGGPPSAEKNEIKLSVDGKVMLTSPNPALPVTIQVRSRSGAVSLTLTNDGRNGTWNIRQVVGVGENGKPVYRVIGSVNLPELANNISSTVMNGFTQVVDQIPGIREVRDIIAPKTYVEPGGYPGSNGRTTIPTAKPLPPITAKPQTTLKPIEVVLGVNRGGPLSPKNFKFLEANRDNALTEVITSLYQGNVVNTYKQAGWKGNWTTPAPVGGRPGVEWQMRLSPRDKNTVDIRVANANETWAYSVNLGKDGRFKVDGPNEQRNLPVYLENLCKGVADSPTVQTSGTVQASRVEKTTTSHPELVKRALQNTQSDEAYVVRGLNDAALAVKNDPGFAKQLKNMMNGVGRKGIKDTVNGVDIVWSNDRGALQVSVSRSGGKVTYANVSYNRQTGACSWNPINLDKSTASDRTGIDPTNDIATNRERTFTRKVEELGNENTVLKKALANSSSREGRIVRLIDTIYFNAAKPDGQEVRTILKQLSRTGSYKDRYGDVRTEATYTDKGDKVVVTGGKGVIIVTVTPADPKSNAYVYRTGIDAEGLPMFKGSATRIKDPKFFENRALLQPRALEVTV